SLTPENTIEEFNKIYNGTFQIYEDDGIFNKDGLTFISIIFPDDPMNTIPCDSDISDKYNLMVSQNDLIKYSDINPEQAFTEYNVSNVRKVIDITSFKQYYNIDDVNFMFGDPAIYKMD
ncbi:hypothetical protein LCGC14_1567720, partial [marine sediment metagenome]